ncbi:intradiol ring-cleavage dioxygenase [Hansschlegelia quercus]|uniref:Intradiol ring-cleavage dioxygenase n=1 Tax=Hansschlegelia quercus TaxID=2528245 RepID=A0A4Q9GI13_9HYPH|nr:intradiol ring-cleavage dioxygenase [Hansschlegelia quercus]TBN51729.1 intradiol ring-cleavage dioxygenase [Hansschlegelia quercus]
MKIPELTRRQTFGALAGGAALSTVSTPALATSALETGAARPACVLPVQAEEGPFYFDPKLLRSDITEGRPGVPLTLELTFIDAATCQGLGGVRVDIWHADAAGRYSGFEPSNAPGAVAPAVRETFLRGTQIADDRGAATFRTIYPGWYRGRTAHIHLKAFIDGRNTLTTQVYFPDALSEYIYEKVGSYSARDAKRDTTNGTDGVLGHTENSRATFLNIREGVDAYIAELTIAVDRNGSPPERRGPPPPPPGDLRGPDDRRGPPPGEGMAPRPRPVGPLVPGAKA